MLSTSLRDTIDHIKYDILLGEKPVLDKSALSAVPTNVSIKFSYGEKGITMTFPQLSGMILYADYEEAPEKILEIINDGLAVYFDIPRYYSKNMKFVNILKYSNGKTVADLPTGKDYLLRAVK